MNRLKHILKEKTGASLLIVLSCMMFLVILATMTLTSSLGVASTTQTLKDKTQIDLMAQSVQISIQDMLNSNVLSPLVTGSNLQTEIIRSVYKNVNHTDPVLPAPDIFDKMTITVEEPGGTKTHTVECDLDIQLQLSASNVTGYIYVIAHINLDSYGDALAKRATYRMGFKLDSAEYDSASDTITNYGNWTLVEYEKIEQ